MEQKKYHHTTIYIDEETLKRVKIYCVQTDVSLSGFVLGLIDNFFNHKDLKSKKSLK